MNTFKQSLRQGLRRRSILQGLGVAAVGITFGGLAGCRESGGGTASTGEEATLNFYNWDTYIGETTLDSFTEGTGIEVQYDLFANNEELFAKLNAQGTTVVQVTHSEANAAFSRRVIRLKDGWIVDAA